MHIETLP